MSKTYSISQFLDHLNIDTFKNTQIHVTDYSKHSNLRLVSDPIKIDFYLFAVKVGFETTDAFGKTNYDKGNALAFFDKPGQEIQWSVKNAWTGYHLLISKDVFLKYSKDYSLFKYSNHEALFVTPSEEKVLINIFQNALKEFKNDVFSEEILFSYATLMLSYVVKFYRRQFNTRAEKYNSVVSNFEKELQDYFHQPKEIYALPSVAYFAEKANLTPNYFGDVVKHFTEKSPVEHIHQQLLITAKHKLNQPNKTISEIAYSLGFDYPTYFTRFFRKKTGITPSEFRKQ